MERCQNCQAEAETLVWVEGFEYWGCPTCAAEATIGAAEEIITCPQLRRVLESARTVAQLMDSVKAHVRTCPACNPQMQPERRAA